MSTYPLAHDIHGNPIDVPPEVAFWRVRRQPSRQGRPSRVTGLDGAPLVILVDAEANDLRAEGCGPDKYRLDGLDMNRQPVMPPVVALTELVPTEADLVARAGGSSDPGAYRMADALSRAVDALSKQEALVRMVESMQRTQSEIMVALVGTKLPANGGGATLKDQIDHFKAIRRLVDGGKDIRNAGALELDEPPPDENAEWYVKLARALGPTVKTPGIQALIARGAGASPEQAVALMARMTGEPVMLTDGEGDDDDDDGDEGDDADHERAGVVADPGAIELPPQLAALYAQLAPAEQESVRRMASKLDTATLRQVGLTLLSMDPADQLAKLRQMIEVYDRREASSAQRAAFSVLGSDASKAGG